MTDAPLIGLEVQPGSPTPLFEQIYDALRRRIITGRIAAGSRLPPSRSLAEELGVSRATIIGAYDQLIAEGFAQGRRGSGVYVGDIGAIEMAPAISSPPPTEATDGRASHRLIPFQPGRPDMRLFPYRQWARCMARVARTDPEAMVAQCDPFGDPRLRAAIARYLAEWRGLTVSFRQILITAGAADALEICLRTLAERGDRIALEDPGYPPLRRFVHGIGMQTDWLGVTANGADLPPAAQRGRGPVLAILTPSSQFPLGGVMPPRQRLDFLKWAEDNASWIVEDDYDSEFRYAGRPIPALASFDQAGRALYVGSFSKIFSDTLRLGFLVMPPVLVPRFASAIRMYGTKASLAPQRGLAVFMEEGEFYRHIRRMRRLYAERRRALTTLLHSQLGHLVTFDDHHAGMQIALRLPAGSNDREIADRAAREGVVCPALSAYFAGRPCPPGLLMGFCGFTAEEMAKPIALLRNVIEGLRG